MERGWLAGIMIFIVNVWGTNIFQVHYKNRVIQAIVFVLEYHIHVMTPVLIITLVNKNVLSEVEKNYCDFA